MKSNWKSWKVLAPLLVLVALLLVISYFTFGGTEYVGVPIGVHHTASAPNAVGSSFDNLPWNCASGYFVPWRKEIVAELDRVPETFPIGTPEKNLVDALKKYGYVDEHPSVSAVDTAWHEFSYWKRTGQCSSEERTIRWCSDASGKITSIGMGNTTTAVIAIPIGPPENQTLTLPNTPPAPNGDPLAEWRAKTDAKRQQNTHPSPAPLPATILPPPIPPK